MTSLNQEEWLPVLLPLKEVIGCLAVRGLAYTVFPRMALFNDKSTLHRNRFLLHVYLVACYLSLAIRFYVKQRFSGIRECVLFQNAIDRPVFHAIEA